MGNLVPPPPGKADEVFPGVFVSGAEAAADRELLRRLGITHVLCCSAMFPDAYFPDEFEYLVLGMRDVPWQDFGRYVRHSNDFIEKALATTTGAAEEGGSSGGKVLVHCRAGRSRSVAICAAFMMTRRGMSRREALDSISQARPGVFPNPGFRDQLRLLDESLAEAQQSDSVLHE